MKKTRRFAAMLAAMALAATMVAPTMMNASADSRDVSVSVKTDGSTNNNEETKPDKDVADHTYTAYEIFKGEWTQTAGADTTDVTTDDEYEFKITGFGTGVNWSTTNGLLKTGSDFMKLSVGTDKTIADVITNLGNDANDVAKAKAIAQVIGDSINSITPAADNLAKIFDNYKTGNGTEISKDSTHATNLKEGYYLVTDTYTADATNDAVSKFILQVAKKAGDNGITIVPKKSYPSVEKKVKENVKDVTNKPVNDPNTTEKWNDVADYDIGSAVPFKLYGTLPSTINDYSAYYYKFTDTLGSQFNQPTSITIKIGGKTLTATLGDSGYTVSGDTGTNCRVKWDNGKLEISFEDIKKYYTPDQDTGLIDTTDVITVEYTAVLNNTANIGLPGQENKVDLTYSNNPNFEYTPDTTDNNEDKPKDDNNTPDNEEDDEEKTDKTPEDKVIVFTYEIDVTKIDGITKEKLQGAEFNLKKGNKFAQVKDNKFVAWVDSAVTGGSDGTTTLTSDANGIFKVIGIDDGTYSLVETKAPEGYNQLSSSITLTIEAETVNNQLWDGTPANALTSIKLNDVEQDAGTDNGKRGHVALDVENNKGSELPSTGGMGTKLFIAGGGITATLAAVYLVSKKRSRKEE